jgi:hypothetical protein
LDIERGFVGVGAPSRGRDGRAQAIPAPNAMMAPSAGLAI